MEDRTEVFRNRRERLDRTAILHDPGRGRRKIDVWLRIAGTAKIILVNGSLPNVADAHIQALSELMFDSEVVLFGIRRRRRVLRNDRWVCSVRSRSGKRRVHGELRSKPSRLRVADGAYKGKIPKRAINI